MELVDIYLIGLQLLLCVLLFLLSGFAVRYCSSKWKLCYLLPAVLCIICLSVGGIEKLMIPVYAGSVIMAAGFFRETKGVRRAASAVTALCTLAGALICCISPDYRAVNYTAQFERVFAEMRARYVLTEHKGIDWDSLYDAYLPRFQEATKEHDPKLSTMAWMELCGGFCDGHVQYVAENEDLMSEVIRDKCGSDFGLSILNYSDGRAVAVNVDSSLAEIGIHDGTVITAWDGMDPAEAAKRSEGYGLINYPEADSAYFFRSLLAAGTGSGKVSFIDDEGAEQTALLRPMGRYYDRANKTCKKICEGYKASNLTVEPVGSGVACLRIKTMLYDALSEEEEEDDYKNLKLVLKNSIRDLMNDGVQDIVIDLRDNGGGSGELVKMLAEIFATKGEHFYCYDGVWDKSELCFVRENGAFKVGPRTDFKGGDILNGGNIVILVNSNSVSAADHLVMVMSGLENTTIMGFTKPNCSGQGVSAIEDDGFMVTVSSSLILDDKGVPLIDAGRDGHSAQRLDVQVPFDEEALKAIFTDGEDYLMQQAIAYLVEKR